MESIEKISSLLQSSGIMAMMLVCRVYSVVLTGTLGTLCKINTSLIIGMASSGLIFNLIKNWCLSSV